MVSNTQYVFAFTKWSHGKCKEEKGQRVERSTSDAKQGDPPQEIKAVIAILHMKIV